MSSVGVLMVVMAAQVSQKEESKVPGLKQRRDNKNSNLAGRLQHPLQPHAHESWVPWQHKLMVQVFVVMAPCNEQLGCCH